MKKTNSERLAVMEEQLKQNMVEHKDIKVILTRVETKIDNVISEKLDKQVFEDYKTATRSWSQYILPAISTVLVIIVTLVTFLK